MSQRGLSRKESVGTPMNTRRNDKSATNAEKEKELDNSKVDHTSVKKSESTQVQTEKNMMTEMAKFQEEIKKEMRTFFKELMADITTKFTNIEDKFSQKFEEIKVEMQEVKKDIKEARHEVTEMKKKTADIEKNIMYNDKKLDDIQHENQSKRAEMREEVEQLRTKLMILEKQDRKYNLLFYGIREQPSEDTEDIMKEFFRNTLSIDEGRVNDMIITNCHRLPNNGEGPKPVIVRFGVYEDRDIVLSKATLPTLRHQRKRILTDLPTEMKVERSRLAKEAYKIRQQEGLQTRIQERGLQVYLEVRTGVSDHWRKRHV